MKSALNKHDAFINNMFMLLNSAIDRRDKISCLNIISVLLNSKVNADDEKYLLQLKKDILNN